MTKSVHELEAELNFLRVGLLACANLFERMGDEPELIVTLGIFIGDLISASASGAVSAELEAEPMICINCASMLSDVELEAMRKVKPEVRACCPERKMVTLRGAVDAFSKAEGEAVAMRARIDGLVKDNRTIAEERDGMRWRLLNAADAIMLLAERAKATPQELAQLGLATYVKDSAGNAKSVFSTLDDLKEALDSDMKRQATAAKFRQIKQHFIVHQRAVTHLLDQLTSVTRKNVVTGEDVQKLRDLRADLQATIRREV